MLLPTTSDLAGGKGDQASNARELSGKRRQASKKEITGGFDCVQEFGDLRNMPTCVPSYPCMNELILSQVNTRKYLIENVCCLKLIPTYSLWNSILLYNVKICKLSKLFVSIHINRSNLSRHLLLTPQLKLGTNFNCALIIIHEWVEFQLALI